LPQQIREEGMMPEKFDPYHRWLSISPEEQPPTLYRLLGLRPFEDKPDVIETAADRQMTYLRTFQLGKHSKESQNLLNQVAAAKLNLLKPEKKAEYDKLLRERMDLEAEGSEPDEELSTSLVGFLELIEAEKEKQAAGKEVGEKTKPPEPQNSKRGKAAAQAGAGQDRNRRLIIGLAICVAVLIVLILVTWAIRFGGGPEKKSQVPEQRRQPGLHYTIDLSETEDCTRLCNPFRFHLV